MSDIGYLGKGCETEERSFCSDRVSMDLSEKKKAVEAAVKLLLIKKKSKIKLLTKKQKELRLVAGDHDKECQETLQAMTSGRYHRWEGYESF